MKRSFDFIASLLGLLFSWPIMLFAAAAIAWETPGSPLFRQQRVGRSERVFTCYKLRTMYVQTKDVPTHEATAASVTKVGAFLRRVKLDELPQLYNVLKGDMSLVGPRPSLPSQKALIEARRKRSVFSVRPGITGLAQVQGIDMSEPERLATVDQKYAQTQSFSGDMALIAATAFGKGLGQDHVAG